MPSRRWGGSDRLLPRLLVVSDPGPDPDDTKAILVAGTWHRLKRAKLCGVIANGGHQAWARARLARCLLDHIGLFDVPVGAGTSGQAYLPKAHEYRIDGYDSVDDARIENGPALFLRTLQLAEDKSLSLVLISALTDFAEVCSSHPDLVLRKVSQVAIQGGLEPASTGRLATWKPDTSANNQFDPVAAERAYAFCFSRGLPLRVVSRHVVPLLPMQLARSFAVRTCCPVMRYLAEAQILGLEGLWHKVCSQQLPARCTKQWYFETFCGVDAETFARCGYDGLQANADIAQYLKGYVKPYDVVALMSVLSETSALFQARRPTASPFPLAATQQLRARSMSVSRVQAGHTLLLDSSQLVDASHVLDLLRDCFHHVVAATERERIARLSSRSARQSARGTSARGLPNFPGMSGSSRRARGTVLSDGTLTADAIGTPAVTAAGAVREDSAVLTPARVREVLARAHEAAGLRERAITKTSLSLGISGMIISTVVFLTDLTMLHLRLGLTINVAYRLDMGVRLRVLFCYWGVMHLTPVLCLLSVQPMDSHLRRLRHLSWWCVVTAGVAGVANLNEVVVMSFQDPDAFDLSPYAGRGPFFYRAWLVSSLLVDLIYWALCFGSSVALWRYGHNPRRMLTVLWRTMVIFWALTFATAAYGEVLLLMAEASLVSNPPLLAVVWLGPAWYLAVTIAMASPRFRASSQALLARTSAWRRTSRTDGHETTALALACITGYGSTQAQSAGADPVEQLMADAQAYFAPFELGASVLARASFEAKPGFAVAPGALHLPALGQAERESRVYAQAASPSDSASGPRWGARTLRADSDTPPASTGAPWPSQTRHFSANSVAPVTTDVALACGSSLTGATGGSPTFQAGLRAPGQRRLSETPLPACDAYIVHSPLDAPEARRIALSAWAGAFASRHGRPPRVWLDVLCTDPSLRAGERLAHVPAYLAWSDGIVVLAGPSFVHDLRACVEVFVWSAMHPGARAVIQPATLSPEDVLAVESTADSVHAEQMREPPGTSRAEVRVLQQAVELATVGRFNAAVRQVLGPLIP